MSNTLTLDEALKMSLLAIQKSNELKVPVSICVMDKYGNKILFFKMDGAIPISEELSVKKAYTSVMLKVPSSKVKKMMEDSLYNLDIAMAGKIVVFGGGLPIFNNGECLGAIGISGGSVQEDEKIALSAIEVIQKQTQ